MTPQQFINQNLPHAIEAAIQHPINPIATLAQAALETGWGRHTPGNMHFGIKATPSWKGLTQQLRTTEYINGQKVQTTSTFRAYPNPQASYHDYATLITTQPRYQQATQYTTYHQTTPYIQAIAAAGYSTSPTYAQTLQSITRTIKQHITEQQLTTALTAAAKKKAPATP